MAVGLEWQATGPKFREMSVNRRCRRVNQKVQQETEREVLLKNKPAMEMQILWAGSQ